MTLALRFLEIERKGKSTDFSTGIHFRAQERIHSTELRVKLDVRKYRTIKRGTNNSDMEAISS